MKLCILVIDESLGEPMFVAHLLEEMENVSSARVVRHPDQIATSSIQPDVVILGPTWLHRAREFRLRFPMARIIGRGPWHGEMDAEFHPWGDELREPALPITTLISA